MNLVNKYKDTNDPLKDIRNRIIKDSKDPMGMCLNNIVTGSDDCNYSTSEDCTRCFLKILNNYDMKYIIKIIIEEHRHIDRYQYIKLLGYCDNCKNHSTKNCRNCTLKTKALQELQKLI